MIKWAWNIIQLIAMITMCHCQLISQTDSLVVEYRIVDDESLVPVQETDSFEPPIAKWSIPYSQLCYSTKLR